MEKFYDLLQKIKETPGLYLGEASIVLLEAFIVGYSFCEHNNNITVKDDWFAGFNEYIAKKYKINTTHNWARIIRFHSGSDSEAFYEFYKEFYEYLKKYPTQNDRINFMNKEIEKRCS